MKVVRQGYVKGLTRSVYDQQKQRFAVPESWGAVRAPSVSAVGRFAWAKLTDGPAPPPASFAVHSPDLTLLRSPVSSGSVRVTWIGHAAFLLQFHEFTLLTDPFLSEYASPLPPFGPKRWRRAALGVGELAQLNVDYISVSHCHYDHLDSTVLQQLLSLPSVKGLLVPSKLGQWFESRRLAAGKIVELDWAERVLLDDRLQVTAFGVKHNANRGVFDMNRTLWAGMHFQSHADGTDALHAADSGYCPEFGNLAKAGMSPRVAMIGIGAFLPREIMAARHASPEEAVKMHEELGAKKSVGMHWGTIELSLEEWDEPKTRLEAECAARGVTGFNTMQLGEVRMF